MVEGQGLSKLLPANLTHSFSAHCSAQNPTKENNFTSFCFDNVDQRTEWIYFCEFYLFFLFFFAIRFENI